MWVWTATGKNGGGFVSAVAHNENPEVLLVRARDRESLTRLEEISRSAIIKLDDADYPFRVIIRKRDFALWLEEQVKDLTYTNFKSEVHRRRGKLWAGAAHRVWDIMHDIQPRDVQPWKFMRVRDNEVVDAPFAFAGVSKGAQRRARKRVARQHGGMV